MKRHSGFLVQTVAAVGVFTLLMTSFAQAQFAEEADIGFRERANVHLTYNAIKQRQRLHWLVTEHHRAA